MATITGSKRLLTISADAMAADNTLTLGGNGVATQTWVNTQIANLVDSAPATLDTLNELAAALGDDPSFATTISNQIAGKLDSTHDMTLTLNGDVSGSATFTNMGNATLTVTVANDSHTHDGRYLQLAGGTMTGTLNAKTLQTRNTFPEAHNTYDLGTTGVRYKNVYAVNLYGDGSNITGLSTGANYYLDGLSFDTGTGVLTASVNGTTNQTVDLDGRYLTTFDITTQTDPKYLRSNAADTATGLITFSGGITGFTNSAGISGSNFNITGVNQITINDPGEGIVFGGGASGSMTLATVDDSSDNILRFSGTGAQLQVGTNRVLTTADEGSGNGLDADTLDGQHASAFQAAGTYNTIIGTDSDINTSGSTIIDNIYVTDGVITSMGTRTLTPGDIGAAYYDHFRSLGTQAFTNGTNPNITTAQLITEMENDGAFDSYLSAFKTSWSYAGNYDLTDAGNFRETAGTSWLTWTDNSSDSTRGNITALAIAPNTGNSAGRVFIYNDQGSSYSPVLLVHPKSLLNADKGTLPIASLKAPPVSLNNISELGAGVPS
jgi:hypothetical protein